MSALSKLLPQHQEDLRKSGLTDETIAKYEFASINQEEASRLLGFSAPSGGWIVKYPKSANFRFKPDNPWDPKQKYLSPKIPLELFITHLAEDAIKDTTIDLFFTEGEKKAIALAQAGYAAISLPGVTAYGSISVMNQLPQLNLQGRTVYLVYDSDKYFNDQVKKAQQRFAEILTKFGAKVKIINIDPPNGKGIDDQLVKKVDFNYYIDSAEDYSESIKNKPIISPPELLSNFLKRNIPPVEFYADGWVQKQGRMCISAPTNIGSGGAGYAAKGGCARASCKTCSCGHRQRCWQSRPIKPIICGSTS